MCRNIKHLYNFNPPATDEEIAAASRQFIRKVTGFTKPSQANEPAVERAIKEVTNVTKQLFRQLSTSASPRVRKEEEQKAKLRTAKRFG